MLLTNQEPQEFDGRMAELMGRQFNMAFTSTTGYGPGHPIAQKAYETFVESLLGLFKLQENVTLLLDRDSLFLDQHLVDKKFNSKRIVQTFKKIGIQSVTFNNGVTVPDLERLMMVLADPNTYADIDAARNELTKFKVTTIQLNYVMFKKVTADEEVINRDGLDNLTSQAAQAPPPGSVVVPEGQAGGVPGQSAAAGTGGGGSTDPALLNLEGDVLSKVSAVFSLKELFENPSGMAGNLANVSSGMDTEAKAKVVAQLRNLTEQIEQGDSSGAMSLDTMMEAVCKLRTDLRDSIKAQKEVGRFFEEEGTVISEVDMMTYRAIVRIVRDEYRSSGTITVKRLANIIRRMMPDVRDLKRLLPQLKEGLLVEGMKLDEYITLVNELTAELKNDGLVEALMEGAEDVGLTVDEIIREIKDNPTEASRLVILAAELKRGLEGDDSQLSDVLSDYIERISGKMALEAPEAASRDGGKALRNVVYRIEKDLVDRVKSQGVETRVISQMEDRLNGHFQEALDGVKSEWLMNVLAKAGDLSSTYLMESLENLMERQTDLQTLGDPLRQVLAAQGYDQTKIQEVYGAIAEKLKQRSQMFLLPRSVLSTNNTTYFLQREIKSHIRYKTPFSCVMVTLKGISGDGETWREITAKESSDAMPDVFKALASHLRDLDFVGSFGSIDKTIPFVILPMTQQSGAGAVKLRMAEILNAEQFSVGGNKVRLKVVVSATMYSHEESPDLKSFLQNLRQRHAAEDKKVSL